MENYRDLSELLESDRGAMAFYNSLPIGLQQKLHGRGVGGVGAFQSLYECAAKSCGQGERECVLPAASANECTGLIQSGGDLCEPDWLGYRNIEPFGLPKS